MWTRGAGRQGVRRGRDLREEVRESKVGGCGWRGHSKFSLQLSRVELRIEEWVVGWGGWGTPIE